MTNDKETRGGGDKVKDSDVLQSPCQPHLFSPPLSVPSVAPWLLPAERSTSRVISGRQRQRNGGLISPTPRLRCITVGGRSMTPARCRRRKICPPCR